MSKSGTCIDLISVNQKFSFKARRSFEAGLNGPRHQIHSLLKLHYTKLNSVKICYRDFQKF